MIETLLGRFGELRVIEHELEHDDAGPEEIWDRWERLHPMWIAARAQLEPAGAWEEVREASIAALRESAAGAGTRSPYLLALLERR